VSKVVILTGAGISAESGIATFRDSGGLWENFHIEDVCVRGCLEKNREKVNQFYDYRRIELMSVQPNKAHKTIATIKAKYSDSIAVITQNVDDLFERAGCEDVIHLHGFLTSIRCEGCNHQSDIGYQSIEAYSTCSKCGCSMRPDIVFSMNLPQNMPICTVS
jgi:NAD-dependent deacetylase